MSLRIWFERWHNVIASTPMTGSINLPEFVTPNERLRVYQSNQIGALTNTLSQHYPVCQAIVGDTCFQTMCAHYAISHTWQNADLNRFGDRFPQWLSLEVLPQSAFTDFQYLADLAQLEWLLHLSYYAADSCSIHAANMQPLVDLARLSPARQARARLLLRPDIFLLQSPYPVADIWRLHQATLDIASNHQPIVGPGNYWVIARQGFKPWPTTINASQYRLLMAIAEQHTLSELSTSAEITELSDLIAAGWVEGFTVAPQIDGPDNDT